MYKRNGKLFIFKMESFEPIIDSDTTEEVN